MLDEKVSILCVMFVFLACITFVQAKDETLTITTYYPSPYGVYNELRAKKMAIGDNYIKSAYRWNASCDPLIPATCGATDISGNAALVIEGAVGIGTTTPQAKLDVNGPIKIKDGTEGAGKVLVSDANGLGSWQVQDGNYQLSCSNMTFSSTFWYNCCRIDKKNGEVKCKWADSWDHNWHDYTHSPFNPEATEGNYQLSCSNIGLDSSHFWYNCCRIDAVSGKVECKWAASYDQPWTQYTDNPF